MVHSGFLPSGLTKKGKKIETAMALLSLPPLCLSCCAVRIELNTRKLKRRCTNAHSPYAIEENMVSMILFMVLCSAPIVVRKWRGAPADNKWRVSGEMKWIPKVLNKGDGNEKHTAKHIRLLCAFQTRIGMRWCVVMLYPFFSTYSSLLIVMSSITLPLHSATLQSTVRSCV